MKKIDMFSEWVYRKLLKQEGYRYNDTNDEKLKVNDYRALFSVFYDISRMSNYKKYLNEDMPKFIDSEFNDFKIFTEKMCTDIFLSNEYNMVEGSKKTVYLDDGIVRNVMQYEIKVFNDFIANVDCNLITLKDKTGFYRYDIIINEKVNKVFCEDLYLLYPDIKQNTLLISENDNKYVKIKCRDGKEVMCIRIQKSHEDNKPLENNELTKYFRGYIQDNNTVIINDVVYHLYKEV